MSRVAKAPVVVPHGVVVKINDRDIYIQGKYGRLTRTIHKAVKVQYSENKLFFTLSKGYLNNRALAGTFRSLVNGMIIGVTQGFTKKLELVGIGYRVLINKNVVALTLGFSHTINYQLPLEITAECPSHTEIILKGADKQVVGQVAAEIRSYRRPEPYKGKGIRYFEEILHIKESKKR